MRQVIPSCSLKWKRYRTMSLSFDHLSVQSSVTRAFVPIGLSRSIQIHTQRVQSHPRPLVIERWRKVAGRIPGRSAGRIFFSRVVLLCWLLFGGCSTPMLPQWHVKNHGHSAKCAGGRLHLNRHIPLTQRSQSGLTMSHCYAGSKEKSHCWRVYNVERRWRLWKTLS